MATNTDLDDVLRGDTLTLDVTAYDEDDAILDLTGCTLWFTVKAISDRGGDDDDAITTCYWVSGGDADGITVADASTGVLRIAAPASDTAKLVPGKRYRYDVQAEVSSEIHTLVYGEFGVVADSTIRTTTP